MELDEITGEIISAAIEVHRTLVPGLLESAYDECLCHELAIRGIRFDRELCLSFIRILSLIVVIG